MNAFDELHTVAKKLAENAQHMSTRTNYQSRMNYGNRIEQLQEIYEQAEKIFYKHPNRTLQTANTRNKRANKLQEMMRWSQGHFWYKAR